MNPINYEELYNDYHNGNNEAALPLYIGLHKRLLMAINDLSKFCSQDTFSKRCDAIATLEENIIKKKNAALSEENKNTSLLLIKMTKKDIIKSNNNGLGMGYLLSMRNLTDKFLKEFLDERTHNSVDIDFTYPKLMYTPLYQEKAIEVDLRLFEDFITLLDKLDPEYVDTKLQYWDIPFDLFLILKFQDQYWNYVKRRLNANFNKNFIQIKSSLSLSDFDTSTLNTENALQYEDSASIDYLLIEDQYKRLLSKDEYQIVKLTEVGYSAKEIALKLGFSPNTIYAMRLRFRHRLRNNAS